MKTQTHIVISAEQLAESLQSAHVVIIDLQSAEHYAYAHIPGAVHLDYSSIVVNNGQAGGLLPGSADFERIARSLGINNDSHVVAYDSEGGAAASRLIWTLHAFGHTTTSLLDGGLQQWASRGNPLERGFNTPSQGEFVASEPNQTVIDANELIERLGDAGLTVLDARSAEEYNGTKAFAARGGRIPGAVHLEWTDALDSSANFVFKPDNVLQDMLDARNIRKGDEIIVHCQTHRRSSLSYVMLKHLGYANVRGYAGSWSEWGNRSDTPIEI